MNRIARLGIAFFALALAAPVWAQGIGVPIKRGVITVDSAPSGDCSAVPGQVRQVRGTRETYVCEGGTWVRKDLPVCSPDPPSGSCDDYAVCLSTSEAALYVCAGGTWQKASGAGDMQKSVYDTDSDSTVDAAESLRGSASVPVDLNGDGTNEYCLLRWGPRCAGTDCNADGTADQTPLGAVDIECDGTADYLLGSNGVEGMGGRWLIEPKGIVVLVADCHGEDFTDYADLCDQYHVPCTFPTAWGDPSKSDPASALQQAWATRANVTIENHTARHAWNGYDSGDWNPGFGGADMNGFTSDGSATCTNGSAVVTGSGTDWGVTDYAVKNGWFVCDWDNDGDIDATDRQHAYKIASVDSTTQITLDRAYDGTTTTTGKYEARVSYAFGIYEYQRGIEAHQEVLGDNYRIGYGSDPGSWDTSDDLALVTKAFNAVPFSGAQKTATDVGLGREDIGNRRGGESIGNALEPSRMSWVTTGCRTTTDWIDAWLESTYLDRSILIINTHELREDSYCSSNPGEGAISRSVLEHLLSQLAAYKASGKLLVVDGASAAAYVRMMGPGAQYEWNLFRNAHFVEGASGNEVDGGAGIPGWIEADSDTSADHVQKDGFTISGDGNGTLTLENTGAAATTDFKQWVRLEGGFYVGAIEIDARDATAGTVYVKFADGFTDADDVTSNLPVLWYEEPGGSTYIRSTSYTVPAGQIKSIAWHMWVPENINAAVYFYVKLSSVSGTVKVSYPAMIKRQPTYYDTRYSGGSGLPNTRFSYLDPSIAVLSGFPDAAFSDVWLPNEQARVDTPSNKARLLGYVDGSGARQDVEWVDIVAHGEADHHVTGTYHGKAIEIDSDSDGTLDFSADGEGPHDYPWQFTEHFYDCTVPVEASRGIPSSYCPRNGGSCATVSVPDSVATGVCKLGTGTTIGNDVSLWGFTTYGPTDYSNLSVTNERDFRVRVRTLSSGGTGYYLVAGGIKTSTSWDFSTITDGAYFWCDPATDNTWHAITMSGGTSTDTDTSQDCNGADSNYHLLRIVYDTSSSAVVFYIDGAQVASHTTNLPVAQAISAWLIGLETTDATADYAYVDWIYYRGVR